MIKLNWFEKQFVEYIDSQEFKEYLTLRQNEARYFVSECSLFNQIFSFIGMLSLSFRMKKIMRETDD